MTSTQNRVMHILFMLIITLVFGTVAGFGGFLQYNYPKLLDYFTCNGIDKTSPQGKATCDNFMTGELCINFILPLIMAIISALIFGSLWFGTQKGNTKVGSNPMIAIYISLMFFFIIIGISWSRYYRQLLPCKVASDPGNKISCTLLADPESYKSEVEFFNTIFTPCIGALTGGGAALCIIFIFITYLIMDKSCTLIFKSDC